MPSKIPRVRTEERRKQASSRKTTGTKAGLLLRGAPSVTRSISDAVCVKDGNIFFLTEKDGSIPIGDLHGYGLYYHDCRYLNAYQLQLADANPIVLAAATGELGSATFQLTNPHLGLGSHEDLPSGEIGILWERRLDPDDVQLLDRISIKNYSRSKVSFPLTLAFGSAFEDVFEVRGLFHGRTGKLHLARWVKGGLVFNYDGADGYRRRLTISFSPRPEVQLAKKARFHIVLDRLETKEIAISLKVSESRGRKRPRQLAGTVAGNRFVDPKSAPAGASSECCDGWPHIQSDNLLLNQAIDRACRDLHSLCTDLGGRSYFAAGVPWFATLFGRDSLITAMQTLPLKPGIAADTLRLLAEYQARAVDAERDAQPGKILHELRVGELATTGRVPHSPYYGTVDATPLFLILMEQYTAWTGDLKLFTELREAAELALQWIDGYGDSNGDGYVDYQTASTQGLPNQGWKDSFDSIINADGSFARPPIALVEVQGYVYRAKLALAKLYDLAGEAGRAAALSAAAEKLFANFNQDFWSDELGTYVLALQAGGQPALVVASNAGQTLWSGIANPEHARRSVRRLMANDMFSGWGIRTLSQNEKAYNPIGYHIGSVWPHDTAMIAEGFLRYGFPSEAMRLFMSLLEAAMNFKEFQMPELYSGFSREQYGIPVSYPAACHPQAWTAGAIPYLLFKLLGLEPNGSEHTLEVFDPVLPDSVNTLDIAGLQVGGSSVNLRFSRSTDGRASLDAVRSEGDLQVKIG